MSKFKLSQRSYQRLFGVHPDLVKIVERAIDVTPIDFGVTEGTRSIERQRKLVASGASSTMKSRHIHGFAVDVVAYHDGEVSWHMGHYRVIANAFEQAANELGLKVEWGGYWKTFPDGPHFQLPHKQYPDPA